MSFFQYVTSSLSIIISILKSLVYGIAEMVSNFASWMVYIKQMISYTIPDEIQSLVFLALVIMMMLFVIDRKK